MTGENPENTDPIIAMYFQALEAINPASVYEYHDMVGSIGNRPVRPLITAPIYMTPFVETKTVLPTVEIFVSTKLIHPEDYEFYYSLMFSNEIPQNTLRAQRQKWGAEGLELGYFDIELNSMKTATETSTPIGVALYGVEQNKPLSPNNTLVGIYHLPDIRTTTTLDMMAFATNNGLAHVRGIEFR